MSHTDAVTTPRRSANGARSQLRATQDSCLEICLASSVDLCLGRWKRCAQLLLHHHLKTDTQERTTIKSMKTSLYLYQTLGVFIMFEIELYQRGGHNADNMGLRKVSSILQHSSSLLLTTKKVASMAWIQRAGNANLIWADLHRPEPHVVAHQGMGGEKSHLP